MRPLPHRLRRSRHRERSVASYHVRTLIELLGYCLCCVTEGRLLLQRTPKVRGCLRKLRAISRRKNHRPMKCQETFERRLGWVFEGGKNAVVDLSLRRGRGILQDDALPPNFTPLDSLALARVQNSHIETDSREEFTKLVRRQSRLEIGCASQGQGP